MYIFINEMPQKSYKDNTLLRKDVNGRLDRKKKKLEWMDKEIKSE